MNVMCPTCGEDANYIEQYSRWYCYGCKQYLEEGDPYQGEASQDRDYLDQGQYRQPGDGVPGPVVGTPADPYRAPQYAGEPQHGAEPQYPGGSQFAGGPQRSGRSYSDLLREYDSVSSWIKRFGKSLMIISVVGLILFLALPWVTVISDNEDGVSETGHYNFQLKRIAGNADEDKIPSSTFGEYEDRIWYSIFGAIGGIIIGAVLLFMVEENTLRNERASTMVLGVMSTIAVLMAVLILFSATTFIAYGMTNELNKTTKDDIDFVVASPASFAALIIGGVMLAKGLGAVNRTLASSRQIEHKTRGGPDPGRGPPAVGYSGPYGEGPYGRMESDHRQGGGF